MKSRKTPDEGEDEETKRWWMITQVDMMSETTVKNLSERSGWICFGCENCSSEIDRSKTAAEKS